MANIWDCVKLENILLGKSGCGSVGQQDGNAENFSYWKTKGSNRIEVLINYQTQRKSFDQSAPKQA